MSSDPPNNYQINNDQSKSGEKNRQQLSLQRIRFLSQIRRIREMLSPLVNRPGVHTPNHMAAAGFKYTGNGDTARCQDCGLEVSHWTADMAPFAIHSGQSPHCPFVCSIIKSSLSNITSFSSSSTAAVRNISISNEQENPPKRRKIDTVSSESSSDTSVEADLIQHARRRTFSHWPYYTSPSNAQMIEAGFFNCNVGDRVICIYCNLICYRWLLNVDDPCEVHKRLSPDCEYVKQKLISRESPRIINPNESSMRATANSQSLARNNTNSLRFSQLLRPAAENNGEYKASKRVVSSPTTSNGKIRSIDDMIQGGFFDNENKAYETCSYCNKSLQNLGPNNDPMIKHAQWLLHCVHARQSDDDELYHKTQESKQERARGDVLKGSGVIFNNNSTRYSRQLPIRDENILSRLIAARLDLPISRCLLNQNLKLSVLSRILENRLQLKHEDSISDIDLLIACTILQKQIDHIDGKKKNIVIPSVKMKQIIEQAEKEQAEILAQSQIAARANWCGANTKTSKSITTKNYGETKTVEQITCAITDEDQSDSSAPINPCVLCWKEEKRLACMPCGHLATCIQCSQSLRACPMCRRDIKFLVQVYG